MSDRSFITFDEFEHEDVDLDGILVSYWPTVMSCTCEVCGESLPSYVKLTNQTTGKILRTCQPCARSVIKHWSK